MKISDKLAKVNDTFEVTKYDNGYKVEVRGRDSSEDWATVNILCSELAQVADRLEEWDNMEQDD